MLCGNHASGRAHGMVDAIEVDLAQDVAWAKNLACKGEALNDGAIFTPEVAIFVGTNTA